MIFRVFLLVVLATMTSCAKPTVIKQGDKDYGVSQRSEELFVYLDYYWKGGKFDDAVELERAFAEWGKEQGVYVYAMGRFPTLKDWQVGFVATEIPAEMEFQLREIKSLKLPAGTYASMETTGNVDYLFRYWRKFKKWLEKDGHVVSGPVIEVYPDIFEKGLSRKNARGELRYPIHSEVTTPATSPSQADSGVSGAEVTADAGPTAN